MSLTQNSKILADDVKGAIKGITRSGTTFTYTCLDGTTGTFNQQDNNTTYSNMTAATSSAAGKAGLVPAPSAGANTKFLRGDATWQTINGSNAKAYLTETYSSGTNWYRKWSDGWIEQGGTGTFGHNTTFSLNKAFTKTTYQVLIITTMEDSHWMISVITPTTSNFKTIVYWSTNHGTSTSVTGHWYACGY